MAAFVLNAQERSGNGTHRQTGEESEDGEKTSSPSERRGLRKLDMLDGVLGHGYHHSRVIAVMLRAIADRFSSLRDAELCLTRPLPETRGYVGGRMPISAVRLGGDSTIVFSPVSPR